MKFIFILGPLALVSSCGKESSSALSAHQEEVSHQESTYLDLVNEHRKSLGLHSLKYSVFIEDVANGHSTYMAGPWGRFGHGGWRARCKKLRNELKGDLCGEIVAMGQKGHKEVLKAWLDSKEHRESIENPYFTHTGLAMVRDAKDRPYWTQMFLELEE